MSLSPATVETMAGPGTIRRARVDLIRSQAERAETLLALRSRELVPAAEVRAVLRAFAEAVRAELSALPAQLAAELAGCEAAEAKQRVAAMLRARLETWARQLSALAVPEAARPMLARGAGLLAPPPAMTVSEWAERNRVLPQGASARPGPWRCEPYQREMLDAILSAELREVVLMTSTQVGKSEILNNIIGYYIEADPKPMLMVQPRDRQAQDYSKKRVAPMIAACPTLKRRVREATSRRAGNTIQLKEFPGGFLKITGGNAGAGLRSDPIAVLLLDEVDGYPDDVDGEGDPVELAERRTDTFHDAKIVKASTPARPRGLSRIEAEWNRSDQRRYHVPCPLCGFMQPLVWRDAAGVYRLVWEKDGDGRPIPDTVRYLCAGCGQRIEERHKRAMLDAGQWIAAHPERREIAGFHLNALYSPWRETWGELAEEWAAAQHNRERLKAFVNLRLGETWDEEADRLDVHVLAGRREKYGADGALPEGVAVLVGAADVQHNRIEAQVVGFGAAEQAWLIAHEIFWGNPDLQTADQDGSNADVWAELDAFLLRAWRHPRGAELRPLVSLVDSGTFSESVYRYVLPLQGTARRVYACKGVDYLSKPGLVAEGATKRGAVRLFMVSTYAAKDRIFSRLKVPRPGPGYIHLPDWTTDEYLDQLTSEQKIITPQGRARTPRTTWVKVHQRNEALDLWVYSFGALAVLQRILPHYRDLGRIRALLGEGRNPAELQFTRRRGMRTLPIFDRSL